MSSTRNVHVEKPVEVQGVKEDAKLGAMLQLTKQATETFLDALKDMQHRMSFKAFTVKRFEDDTDWEKMDAFMDLLQSAIVMALGQIDPESVKKYNMDCSVEHVGDEAILWMHGRHKEDLEHAEQPAKEDEVDMKECENEHSEGDCE